MSFQVIYFTRFMPTYDLGGGSRRMLQIHNLLKTIDPELQLISHLRGDRIPEPLREKMRGMRCWDDVFAPPRLSLSLRKWREDHRGMVFRLRKFSKIWAGSVKELPELDMAIMDDPIYFRPLFKKLRQLHIPVIAVCHNIETLASNQVGKKWKMRLFKEEVELFTQCRWVITISREEDVLLKNLGVRSLYIPYYPVEAILARLLAVREKRGQNTKDGFLAIGNVMNLQTREGMKNLGRYWRENHLEVVAGKLLLGGFKSDEFFTPGQFGDSVEFLGTLPHDALDHILSRVKACICYQETGAGSLTRIGEMLIAGVPVLANTHAARSYYNMKGVIEFRELDELGEALGKADKFDGDIPLPQAPDISSLSLEIQRILQ